MTATTRTEPTSSAARTAGLPQALTLMVVSTMPTMALAALVPVLPAFFQHFAAVPNKETLVPMILTVPSLCVALFSAPIGAAADRWGRRPVLLLALLAFAVCGVLPMLFDDLHAIIATRVVVGVAEAAVLTVGNALLGDYFVGSERQKWLGLQMSIGPFVGTGYLLAGGALGSWLWKGPFLIYLLGFVALALAWWTLHEPARSAGAIGASSITSQTLSMRSRSRPVISRSCRCMNRRCSQAVSQAPRPTTTSSHCPFSDAALTRLPSRSVKGRSAGTARAGSINVP